jgi:outer membrane protein TolC
MQSILRIAGLALCAQGAFAQTPLVLTLQDAMQRARKYSQQVYTANLAALLAHEDAVQAKAGLLPTAEAISGYIYTQPNGTPTGIYVPNDGPHVYTELLDLHGEVYNPARRAEYHRIMAAEAVAQAKKDLAERGLVATVTQNFYAMDVAQRKVTNAQSSRGEARDFQDLSEKQERGGEAARVDVVKARLQVQQRERDLQDAEATLD